MIATPAVSITRISVEDTGLKSVTASANGPTRTVTRTNAAMPTADRDADQVPDD
jgi:hypothetical protein